MGKQPIDGVLHDWLDTAGASALTGYDQEFLRQMARAWKRETRKVGRTYFVKYRFG